jgi:hypothetical protein
MEIKKPDLNEPTVHVTLSGNDGNAFAVIGMTRKAMKDAGCSSPHIEKFVKEATSGDYDHLLQTVMRYCEVD